MRGSERGALDNESAGRGGIRPRSRIKSVAEAGAVDHPGDREVRDIASIFVVTRSARARNEKKGGVRGVGGGGGGGKKKQGNFRKETHEIDSQPDFALCPREFYNSPPRGKVTSMRNFREEAAGGKRTRGEEGEGKDEEVKKRGSGGEIGGLALKLPRAKRHRALPSSNGHPLPPGKGEYGTMRQI